MPETLSTPEVAHQIAHGHHRSAELLEIVEAVLLAVVAIATAWSGYQTARWDGRQAELYGHSNKARAAENRASTLSGQQRLYDTSTFGFWLQEKASGHERAAALFVRRFRPEYRIAFDAWLKTDPVHNPHAPIGPLLMPQYRNAAAERAKQADERATAQFEAGTKARERGDRYLRNTVLLATVLFLTAVAQRFKLLPARVTLLVIAAALLGIALYYVSTYPTA
jgi:hypothetical protein